MKILTGILGGLALVAIIFMVGRAGSKPSSVDSTVPASGVTIDQDGTQIIDITVKGGYFPRNITAKANTASVIKFLTKNTFDCSSALVIPSLNVRKNLPSSGVSNIEVPPQKPGTKLIGTCSMGMYSFTINFI